MKITKTRLRQIIKEEVEGVMEARQPRHKIKAVDVKKARNILNNAGHGYGLDDEGNLQADEKSAKLLTLDGIGVRSLSNESRDPIDMLVTQNAQKAIKIIDSGKTDPDDDQENIEIIRDVFEKILEYDRNEMISYIEDALPHYKTRAIRQALNSIATVYKNA